MLNIIKADLFRIFKGKGIYVIIILLLVSAFLSAYSLSPLNMGLNLGSENNSSLYGLTNEEYQELYNISSIDGTREYLMNHGNYSLDKVNMTKNNNLYYFFIAIIIFIIGCDFSNKTIKNTISTNISKRKYYFSKLILSLAIGTALVFINAIFCHFTNIIINGNYFTSSLSEMFMLIIKQLPLLYSIISLLFMISVLTRKTSIYNGITIPLVMVFQIILLSAKNVLNLPSWLPNYEWETAITKLCINPTTTYTLQTYGIWITIFVIATLIGYNSFKARDI